MNNTKRDTCILYLRKKNHLLIIFISNKYIKKYHLIIIISNEFQITLP